MAMPGWYVFFCGGSYGLMGVSDSLYVYTVKSGFGIRSVQSLTTRYRIDYNGIRQ